jgi:hypothetical protein
MAHRMRCVLILAICVHELAFCTFQVDATRQRLVLRRGSIARIAPFLLFWCVLAVLRDSDDPHISHSVGGLSDASEGNDGERGT